MPTTFTLYPVQSRPSGVTVTPSANPPGSIEMFFAAITGAGYTLDTQHVGLLCYWSPSGSGSPLDPLKVITVDPNTDTITCPAHGYANNTQLVFQASGQGGALPVGLDDRTVYWLINRATNTFKVSLTRNGPAVDIQSLGIGTLYVTSSTWWFTAGWDSSQSHGGQVFTADPDLDVLQRHNHGLVEGQAVTLQTLGTLPAPLTASQYFVRNPTAHTLQLSTAAGGPIIDLTDAGEGEHAFVLPNNPAFTPIPTRPTGYYCGVFQIENGPVTCGVDVTVLP